MIIDKQPLQLNRFQVVGNFLLGIRRSLRELNEFAFGKLVPRTALPFSRFRANRTPLLRSVAPLPHYATSLTVRPYNPLRIRLEKSIFFSKNTENMV